MDDERYAGLLDLIYDSALDARLWPRVLVELSDLFDAGPMALLYQDQETFAAAGITARLDPGALDAYARYYGARNPLMKNNKLANLDRELPITLDQEVISKSELQRTEFYNDFYLPNDMHSALMITIGGRGRNAATVNVMRAVRGGDFDAGDVSLARALQPHLARAFRLNVALGVSSHNSQTLLQVMEHSPRGLFLIGSDGAVRFVNDAGQAMLGDGVSIVQGEFVGTSPHITRGLRRLIAEATTPWQGERRGGTMSIDRQSLRRPLSAVVTPLRRDQFDIFGAGPAALLYLSDPERGYVPEANVLQQLFGLSPAEVRMAERVMIGDTPKQAAEVLGIGLSTARWHLSSLYRKTGTSRQAELLRLLVSLARA